MDRRPVVPAPLAEAAQAGPRAGCATRRAPFHRYSRLYDLFYEPQYHRGTVKETISLPAALFERLELERRRRKVTRSALFAELGARHIREQDEAMLAARYTAGYARYPEGSDDGVWVADAGASTLAAVAAEDAHDWSEDYRLDRERDAPG